MSDASKLSWIKSEYSDYLEIESARETKNGHIAKSKKNPVFICINGQKYRVVSEIAKELQWKLTNEHNLWNIYWTDSIMGVSFCLTMHRFQKINHFPGMMEISRKDKLARNLNRMLKVFPDDYHFFPKTWVFPANYADALTYGMKNKNKTFIIKPAASAQGKGIYLTQNLQDVNQMEGMICQLYLRKPLLIDGFKFDLRVYTLITSLDPLRIYIYNEGLTRFATKPYKIPARHNTTNTFMHLTNYSLNKFSETFSTDKEKGSKRTFTRLNEILSKDGYDIVQLWKEIDDIVIKVNKFMMSITYILLLLILKQTVISALPVLKHNYNASFPRHDVIPACFEILGIDIMLDLGLKPWLLEVNHSPSFSTSEWVDKEVKSALIRDTFNLLGVHGVDRRKVLNDDQNRLKKRMTKEIKLKVEIHAKNSAKNEKIKDPADRLKGQRTHWDKKQAKWEQNHLGGFRRIMPCDGALDLYSTFIDHQDGASVYKETISTLQKRQAAAELRRSIGKKILILPQKPKETPNELPKKLFKPVNVGYLPNTIADWEEKQRKMMMASRSFLVESCGLRAAICRDFQLNHCGYELISEEI